VGFAGDRSQHPSRVRVVDRLFQEFIAEENGRVCGDDPGVVMLCRDRRRFVARQPRHVLLGRLARLMHLGDIARHDVEHKSDRCQQLRRRGDCDARMNLIAP